MTIGKDKKIHFAGCAAMAFVVGYFFGPGLGFGSALIFGGLKEAIWDWGLKKGTPEWMDVVADGLGAAVGAGLVYFI